MELYDEASNQAVVLDLPAYDGLLTALVNAQRSDEALDILRDIVNGEDVCPAEQTCLPVLVELVKSRDYTDATALLKQGQARGVAFTSETFHVLLELAEQDGDSTDALFTFLSFIEDAWEEVKDFDAIEDDVDDLDTPFQRL